jgi:hypothetical protein
MSHFIKTGYWANEAKGYKEWLNLTKLIQSASSNIYNSDGALTSNRTIDNNGKTVSFTGSVYLASVSGFVRVGLYTTGSGTLSVCASAGSIMDLSSGMITQVRAFADGNFVLAKVGSGPNYANDAAAAVAGVPVGGLYKTTVSTRTVITIRVA